GLGHNSIIFMIEAQVHYILECMKEAKHRGVDYLNVKKTAQDQFNEEIQERIKGSVWTSGCSSWYQQSDGKNFVLWPYSTLEFWKRNKSVVTAHYDWVKVDAATKGNKVTAAKAKKAEAVA
ncbi:MAG: 4-hydroxyacetophenone monooxygenase, partial [Pseudomonadota bacterium]|nr:4-hydroxyacetophenone monooxygenase [Pseudomonadota bacterium]